MFMSVCSTFRSSDFLLFVKNGFVVGPRTLNVIAGGMEGGRKGGRGGREGGRGGRGGRKGGREGEREGGRERASVEEGRVKGEG